MTERSIHKEDIMMPNAYRPSHRASKCMKQREIDKSTIICGNFIPHTPSHQQLIELVDRKSPKTYTI